MLKLAFFLSYLLSRGSGYAVRSHQSDDGLSVKTSSGEVRGFINNTAPHVRQFLGVPYAEPPLDYLRFMPPQPKHENGAIDATRYQPSCMQQTSNEKTIYTEQMPQFLINGGQSEDCLYVNIYAPLDPAVDRLPVFIYIPGGGHTSGGANSLYKIPDKWIERTQSHIFVIMNYRVNLFGYPSATAQKLNLGLLDQRMVVEWTRDNIEKFGGDPEGITIMGQSAGGGSVDYYAYAYPDDHIVRGLIAESGIRTPLLDGPDPTNFTNLAHMVGCGGIEDAHEELRCMQSVDAQLLEDTNSKTETFSFKPKADGVTAFPNKTERIEMGRVARIPMLTGTNNNEGSNNSPYNEETGPPPDVVEAGNKRIICTTNVEVESRHQHGLTTYRYQHEGNFTNISPLPWIGATHSAELPLIFGTHYEYRGNSTEFEWQTSETMEALWLAFATDPSTDPTDGNGFTWKKWDPDTETTVIFARDDKTAQLVESRELLDIC